MRIILILCVMMFFAVTSFAAPTTPATVTGKTLRVILGHPGALSGNPEPNWKSPAPTPISDIQLYWLLIDNNNGYQLFSTKSGKDGNYVIQIPPGKYLVESASKHWWELQRLEKNNSMTPKNIMRAVFNTLKKNKDGGLFFDGEPDLEVLEGQNYTKDVEAETLFVD